MNPAVSRNSYTWVYFGLSACFAVFFWLHSMYGLWEGDFWEHAAVVKELASHPLAPRHPLLLIDKPHAFFSPYLLAVAAVVNATALHPINALILAGQINLILLLFGLRYFIRMLVEKNPDLVATYALLLLVFLWPAESAWGWSGFLHFGILGLTLPYPSTAALALSFFFLGHFRRALSQSGIGHFSAAVVLQGLILLMHPTTAVFSLFAAGIFTLHVSRLRNIAVLARGVAIVLLSVSLASFWPYFPFLDLFRANTPEFHERSVLLYDHPWQRLWPILLALILLLPDCWRRLRSDVFDPLVLLIAGLAAIYLAGYLTGQYGLGRVVSQFAMFVQILLAIRLAQWSLHRNIKVALPFAVLLPICLYLNLGNAIVVQRAYTGAEIFATAGFNGYKQRYAWMERALSQVGQYDLVLTDLATGWYVPAFSGKVVASEHPVHWVPDMRQRRQDLERFFSAAATPIEQRQIIEKYRARYILVPHALVPKQALQRFIPFGRIVYQSKALTLIQCEQ